MKKTTRYGLNTPGPNPDKLFKEYTQYMSVTDNTYGNDVTQAFVAGGTSKLKGNLVFRGIEGNKLVYWGESHDTYSNSGRDAWSKYVDQQFIDRSYAIMAGNNDATTLYYSRPLSTMWLTPRRTSSRRGARSPTTRNRPLPSGDTALPCSTSSLQNIS